MHSVDHVDLQRYTGRWYEIARLPNRFQKHCSGDVVASYALRSDDRIDVTNVCRRDDGGLDSVMGVARQADSSSTARLQVRFAPAWLSWLWLVWGDYWVLDLDADYQTSLVGTPNHDYLWLLARQPRIDAATYDRLMAKAAAEGFDVSQVVKTPQSAAR